MDIYFKIESKRKRFALSFISAIIYQIGFHIIFETCNFTVYFLSYIHYNQDWVDINYGNLMRPLIILFLCIFAPLSGIMEQHYGIRISIIISAILVEIAFILLYFQQNLWYFYSLSLLLGIGTGLSNQLLIKNCCLYYPKKKGLINALLASIGTISGSGYSILGEKVINPKREVIKKIPNQLDEPYYSKEIAENSKIYFLFASILIPSSTIISIFLLYKYDENNAKVTEMEDEKIEKKINEINGPLNDETSEEEQNNSNKSNPNISNSFSKKEKKKKIKIRLITWRFWRNILLAGAMPFILWFESATSRAYSLLLGVDGKVLGILAGSISFLGCLTNPIWAFCVDKFGFRPIIIVISSLTVAISIYFFVFMDNKLLYVIGLYISSVLRGGVISSFIPHMMQIVGLKYFLTVGGLGRLFTQMFSFGAAFLSIIISLYYKNAQELLFPYRIVSIVSIGFAVFGLVLSFFENDDKFDFKVHNFELSNDSDEESGEIKDDNEKYKDNKNRKTKEENDENKDKIEEEEESTN